MRPNIKLLTELTTALILIYLCTNTHSSVNANNAQSGMYFSESWSLNIGSIYQDLSICDSDRDGELEIMFHGGSNLYCLNPDGTIKWIAEDHHVAERFSLADINEDGKLDFIIPSLAGGVVVRDHNGKVIWFYESIDFSWCAYPCISDINNDGDLEIVINSRSKNPFVLDKNGNLYKRYNLNTTFGSATVHSTPIAADINLNNETELLIISSDGNLYCLDHRGSKIWAVEISLGLMETDSRIALARTLENKVNILVTNSKELLCLNYSGHLQWKYVLDDFYRTYYPISSDIDNDGITEILFTGFHQNENFGILYCLDSSGNDKWSYNLSGFPREPMIADITRDDREEIIFTSGTKIYCLNSSGGVEYIHENLQQNGEYIVSRITDIDHNGHLDLITATNKGELSCLEMVSSYESSNSWWTNGGTYQRYGQPDRDGDGIDDLSENLIYHTDSTSKDSDKDKLPDSWEIEYGLDPLLANAEGDEDGDGLNNLKEFSFAKNPRNWDNWPRLFGGYFSPIWLGMLVAIVNFYRKNKANIPKIIRKYRKR